MSAGGSDAVVGSAPRALRLSRGGLALVLLLLFAGLTSCSAPKGFDPCGWMKPATGDSGRTVILVDASASARGSTGGAPDRDYSVAIRSALTDAVKRKDTISVGSFGGTSPDIAWSFSNRSADWSQADNDQSNEDGRKAAGLDCLTKSVAAAQIAVPQRPGTDVLAAVRAGSLVLGRGSGTRRLFVLTDGLSTTGCADLRTSAFKEPAEAEAIAQVCLQQQEITSGTLASVHTVLLGVGQPGSGQPGPNPAQQNWLLGLWKELCVAAHPVSEAGADYCSVDTVPVAPSVLPSGSATAPADPVVTFASGAPQTYRLGGAALFTPGSWTVLPQAEPALAKIAVVVRSRPGAKVAVYGYVDPRGGTANNLQLSQARADAVKAELVRRGVERITASGRGVADGCQGQSTGSDASSQAQELQCDRRVDIVISN